MTRLALTTLALVAPCLATNKAKPFNPATRFLASSRPSTVSLITKNERLLQDDVVVSEYTALWFFVREGSCALTEEPDIVLKCDNGGTLEVTALSAFVTCNPLSSSEAACEADTIVDTGHAVDFTCTGDNPKDTIASATILTETSNCLGGSDQPGDWGRGILLGYACGTEGIIVNGTCTNANTTFSDNTCTSGFECKEGNCTAGDLTIPDLTSAISEEDILANPCVRSTNATNATNVTTNTTDDADTSTNGATDPPTTDPPTPGATNAPGSTLPPLNPATGSGASGIMVMSTISAAVVAVMTLVL